MNLEKMKTHKKNVKDILDMNELIKVVRVI